MAKAKRKPTAKTKSKVTKKVKKVAKKAGARKAAPKRATAKRKVKKVVKSKKAVKSKKTAKTKVKKPAKKAARLKVAKKGKTKAKSKFDFSTEEKQAFLNTVTKIIDLHRADKDGLKSLTRVERILDQYNQQYKDAHGKFDAIVGYGMEEDPSAKVAHVFVPVHHKEKEVTDFYKLLVQIGKGKIKFNEAKAEIDNLYDQSIRARRG